MNLGHTGLICKSVLTQSSAAIVHLSDSSEQTYRTHGDSYEEAARNDEEVLQLLLEENGLLLPKPNPFMA